MKTCCWLRLPALALFGLGMFALARTAEAAPAPAAVSTDNKSTDKTPADGKTPTAAETVNTTAGKTTATKSYALRPGDTIAIAFVEDPGANEECKISADGTIRLTYLKDDFKIAGATVSEAIAAVTQAYVNAKIYANPHVGITIKDYAPRWVNFFGQVNHPGQISIPPESQISLVTAFALAGGHTRIASRYCTITRLQPDGKSATITFDLRAAVEDAAKDIPLQDGDTISIGESLLGDAWD